MLVKAILFDLDGTLVDSLSDIAGILNRVRKDRGLPLLSMEETRPHIGWGVDHLVRNTFPRLSELGVKDVIQSFRAHYKNSPHEGGKLYDGVAEILEDLRPKYRLGIATNKLTAVAEATLAHYLPAISWDFVAGADKPRKYKPAPEHLWVVLEALKVEPHEALYIGDSPVDQEAARLAKVPFLAAGYGFGLVQAEPEITLQKFSDLLKHLP